ncbi:hypothetical protein jhhlp_000329 [Lomentospora prolificans]|uniref:C6 finger domain protein n=1 Tax=Lomentospora prolificans TaxID=41688 RepID=A0A2N3NKQ5_9PEZI|nr:hypothetical protein jhhlp_000329 [Lomentospora prolificans]
MPSLLQGENYSLLHLELLYHHINNVVSILHAGENRCEHLTSLILKEAFRTPYLMDEILAISAAHLSTEEPSRREYYLTEATRLQTRAISQFNSQQAEISEENCLAPFMFSAFLGQHVIFDAFSSYSNFPSLLEKFVQCLGIHRGIRAIASKSWPKLRDLFGVKSFDLRKASEFKPHDECRSLVDMVSKSDLSQEGRAACIDAIECTQQMFDYRQPEGLSKSRQASVFQEWPVRVSVEYVALLQQRRPEALVLLAYYAILLHYTRDHWAVGDIGAFIIREITCHLGPYWSRWLELPNQVLMEDMSPSAAAYSARGTDEV